MRRNSITRREALRLGAAGAVTLALHTGGAEAALGAPEAVKVQEAKGPDGREAVLLTDMRRCLPKSALADHLTFGKWRHIAYTAGPYTGVLLWSPSGNQPARAAVPLGAKGWYRVYAGLYAAIGPSTTLFRFTKEPAFIARKLSRTGRIEEVPLGAWDLTGQDLEIAARTGGDHPEAGLAYIRLEPISEEDGKRESAMGRGLTATIDGFSYFHERNPQTAQELWEEVWYFKQSDVDQLILQFGGADTTNYPTRVGNMLGTGQSLYPRTGDRDAAQTFEMFAKKGINPTKEMIKAAHAAGIETLIGYRLAAWDLPGIYDEFFLSKFYAAHPEWRTYDRDGTLMPRLSYAVPEVRRHVVESLREAVRFGADGASLLFNRGTPLVLFEKAFSDPFKAKYGVDPASLPDDDPKVLDFRAEIVGQFVREVRAMLDEEGKARGDGGKRLKLSAVTLIDGATNRYYGIDLANWIDAGLLDSVAVWGQGPFVPGAKHPPAPDLAYYRGVCAPKNIAFRVFRRTSIDAADPKVNAQKFAEDYAAGADGFLLWDANFIQNANVWRYVARSGSPARVRALAANGAPPAAVYAVTAIGGNPLHGSRFSVGQGF